MAAKYTMPALRIHGRVRKSAGSRPAVVFQPCRLAGCQGHAYNMFQGEFDPHTGHVERIK